ncbi:hypothetical protein ACIBU0_30110 [Streptomyces sp. NPDC049627]|uniref:Rv1733c family protein n=1 Tax=Streptomyces sp. NPDC049627 TaxID=3365595 RepID=UPI0037892F1B
MRSRVRGWRWRRSPLRRRSDVVEAWTVVAVIALLFVGAPLAGVVAAWWAHDDALTTVREQRADRRHVRAEVIGRSSAPLPAAQGGRQLPAKATVRWTEQADGPRTATARVAAGTRSGDMVDLWLDSQGRSVSPPPGSMAVWHQTVTIGVCATGGAGALVLLGHTVVRHAAMRRRLAEWEQEWARTEPEWTGRRA